MEHGGCSGGGKDKRKGADRGMRRRWRRLTGTKGFIGTVGSKTD